MGQGDLASGLDTGIVRVAINSLSALYVHSKVKHHSLRSEGWPDIAEMPPAEVASV